MKLSELLIKLGALALIVIGFALLLSAVGVPILGIGIGVVIWDVVVGVLLLGLGIHLARGGNVSL